MTGSSGFSISWEQYKNAMCTGLQQLQQRAELVDMTIAADGHIVRVHQLVISLASSYLKDVIRATPTPHPVLFLNNVSHKILCFILEYMYTGEVVVPAEDLRDFITTGKALQVKGVMDMILEESSDHIQIVEPNVQTNDLPQGQNNLQSSVNVLKQNLVHQPSDIFGQQSKKVESPDNTVVKCSKTPSKGSILEVGVSKGLDHRRDESEFDTSDNYLHDIGPTSPEVISTLDKNKALTPKLMFCRSNMGSLQIILNRFMYRLKHTYKDGRRRWECVNTKALKCQARLVTHEDTILSRLHNHNHANHDKKIMKKANTHGVYASLQSVTAQDDLHRDDD